ncbi:MAG: cofactor-independent phosphoglycerate mutase [Kiritimatiellae bacterium]|nr:cofactor-independent phosphoglycerate mutase [Kiritimatiellia bacterium]MDD5520720.1 cofactor-independent phosphoglycerate mutase [Kiritimatiellia bacterium]
MRSNKTIIFLGDGMADEPIAELGGKTPLQFANTPAMDSIARDGVNGTLLTLPQGFPTSSEVANMSVLGCDLETEYCGRGPLEAAGRGIPLGPEDKAFRINLVTVENGVLKDFSGGHIAQNDANELIKVLNDNFGNNNVRFYPGVSYRNILVLRGKKFSHRVKTEKPDDNHEEHLIDHLPSVIEPDAEQTVCFLQKIMIEATAVLETTPVNRRLSTEGKLMANGVWPWSGGKAGSLKTLKEKYGISGGAISAVDVIVGLGRCLGMEIIPVPGATGYIDTNYEGKADAAIKALKNHDFVYLHLEAIDEVSHEQDLKNKIRAIENFDSRIVGPVLAAFGPELNVAVLPDHPVPIATGKHTRNPVPVAVRITGQKPDSVRVFDETACKEGMLGAMKNGDLMNLFFRT